MAYETEIAIKADAHRLRDSGIDRHTAQTLAEQRARYPALAAKADAADAARAEAEAAEEADPILARTAALARLRVKYPQHEAEIRQLELANKLALKRTVS